MDKSETIFITGHRGLVGSALLRAVTRHGYTRILTRTHAEVDLCDQGAVRAFFAQERPRRVIVAAGLVGGIVANNTRRAEFLYQNLMISANVIDAAYRSGTEKLLYLGSSCIYPRDCAQPMHEEYLLSGRLETTNEPYALAKIAGVKLVENYHRQYGCNFISAMPTNLYGENDNFDLTGSHVLPALIRKFHEAKLAGDAPVTVWGSGTVRREFLHVDDLSNACVFLLEHLDAGRVPGEIVNIGCGSDLSIRELATLVQRVVGHRGDVHWDTSKPDGTPRKLLDVSRLTALGWTPSIGLEEGITATYRWYAEAQRQGLAMRTGH
jgi:GDP-L-fucose synthase